MRVDFGLHLFYISTTTPLTQAIWCQDYSNSLITNWSPFIHVFTIQSLLLPIFRENKSDPVTPFPPISTLPKLSKLSHCYREKDLNSSCKRPMVWPLPSLSCLILQDTPSIPHVPATIPSFISNNSHSLPYMLFIFLEFSHILLHLHNFQ